MGAEMTEKDRDLGQNIMIQTVNVSKTFSGKFSQNKYFQKRRSLLLIYWFCSPIYALSISID